MVIVPGHGWHIFAGMALFGTVQTIVLPPPGTQARPAGPPYMSLAQADDLAPPSPDALVSTPPPAPLAETPPAPFPGFVWDPGHWVWNGTQYVWEDGKYIVQPTGGATFTPGYWQHYHGGWAWIEGRWSWTTQDFGE